MIYIASYPRSGNTMLRTVLWHCFGLKSTSIYPNDLGGNKALERYVGHYDHTKIDKCEFVKNRLSLIKTHEPCHDNTVPAIYIVRDGRAACVSLWEFYRRSIPLQIILDGNHRFGSWGDHYLSWQPLVRPNTLLIRYEKMVSNLGEVLMMLSQYLQIDIQASSIPDRESIADADGQWVRKKTEWQTILQGDQLSSFTEKNRSVLEMLGYL